jgi:tetratricopeptide (TPR) repeat protein
MKRQKIIVGAACAITALFAGVLTTFAQPDAQFAKANQEYAQGHFKQAIDGYEELIRSREWSANLFYDLGNAYFRVGDFGHAILNYERALALEPHHPETQANLRIARDEARALELQSSWPERYLQFATVNQDTIAAAIAFWLGAFCLAALIFSRRRSARVMALSIFAWSFFALLVTTVFWIDNGNKGRALAIITGSGVEARLATADNANSVLALPPGSEVKIASERGDWVYATLPNNLRGWIPAKSVETVRL